MEQNGTHLDMDEELLARLRRLAAELDPPPDHVLAAARSAILTRDLDSELAALVADSAADQSAYEPVRSSATETDMRLLTFVAGDVHVDLEVTEHGDRVDLVGMLSGASPEGCVIEYASGARHPVEVDSLGRFLAAGLERGVVRARCRSAAGTPVVTAWVRL